MEPLTPGSESVQVSGVIPEVEAVGKGKHQVTDRPGLWLRGHGGKQQIDGPVQVDRVGFRGPGPGIGITVVQRPSESVSEPLLLRGELVREAEAEYQAEFGAN